LSDQVNKLTFAFLQLDLTKAAKTFFQLGDVYNISRKIVAALHKFLEDA
jgi:hypothetical protein